MKKHLKKLALSKETLRKLETSAVRNVEGGSSFCLSCRICAEEETGTCTGTCTFYC